MSALNSLKLVTAKKPVQTPVAVKRNKLLTKLQDQIDLMTAQQAGRLHHVVRTQWVTDTDSGARVAVEVHKRVREWFWHNSTPKFDINVYFLLIFKSGILLNQWVSEVA